MPEFQIDYSKTVPRGAQMPRANVNVDTGAGMIGRAVAGLGGAMFDVGQKIQLAQDAMQLSDLNRQREEADFAAEQQLMKMTDADEQQKFIEDHFVQQAKLPGKTKTSGRVANAYQQNLNNTKTDTLRRLTATSLQARAKDAEDKHKFAREAAINKGDLAGVHKIDSLALSTEIIGPEQFKALSDSAPIDVEFAKATMLSTTNIAGARAMLTEAEFQKKLSPDQVIKRDGLIAHFDAMENRSRSALREQQEKETWDLFKASEDGTLTQEMLDKSVMPADEKQEIWRNFKNAQAQKVKTGISQIEEGDPAVLAQVNAIIDLRPDDITPEQIYRLVDRGLGTKYITSSVDRLKRNQAEKNPTAAKYRAELGRLHTAGLFGKTKKLKTSDVYLNLSRKLDTFLNTNPSDEQAQKFFSTLIREDVSWGNSFGANELPGFGEYPLKAEITTEVGKKAVSVTFGEIVEVDGEYYQAVGRKEGQIQWLKVNPR